MSKKAKLTKPMRRVLERMEDGTFLTPSRGGFQKLSNELLISNLLSDGLIQSSPLSNSFTITTAGRKALRERG